MTIALAGIPLATAWLLVRECERSAKAQAGLPAAVELRAVARTVREALKEAGATEPVPVFDFEDRRF